MLPTADPFSALGDENRRSILRLLADGERSVGDLASSMPISRPAVSRHLRLLREAGLVKERAVGARRLYALDDLGAEAVRSYIESVWGQAMARYRLVTENTSPRRRHAR
jgi:DNA-binding transcriptional ArsR family regulator